MAEAKKFPLCRRSSFTTGNGGLGRDVPTPTFIQQGQRGLGEEAFLVSGQDP